MIFSKNTDPFVGDGLKIWIDENNTLRARLTSSDLIGQPLVGPVLDLNKWYNIAFVRDASTSPGSMKFFVNGYLASSIMYPTDKISISPFFIGREGDDRQWKTTCINAVIDEMRISDRV